MPDTDIKRGATAEMDDIKIELPDDVKNIISQLEDAGYEAYAVGGCIRDSLLSRKPNDWDITTSAVPTEIKKIFRHTVDTGIKHGTVTVLIYHEDRSKPCAYEVTTYRIDGEYEDSRHPVEVTFTSNLGEDLKRRDFTINAMAYNDENGLADPCGGIRDLKDGHIRCVGDPDERFSEDALRILRAVRFSAQLGFDIEEKTGGAAARLSGTLCNISAERIRDELVKLVTSVHPEFLEKAYELGITGVVLPEFDRCMQTPQNNPHHCYNVGEHILHSMMNIEPDAILRLTMLFHDMGKPDTLVIDKEGITHNYGHATVSAELAAKVMKRLKFDNDTISKVTRLTGYHDIRIKQDRNEVRHAVNKIGKDYFPMLLKVKRADIMAKSEYCRIQNLETLSEIEKIYEDIKDCGECVCLKDLDVTGGDLIAAGMKQGPEVGEALNEMLRDVLDHPEHNDRKYLIEAYRKRNENR